MRLGYLAALLTACGFHVPADSIGDGSDRDAAVDGATPIDALADAPADARVCFGTGLLSVCLTTLPTQATTLSGTIDTGNDASCTQLVTQGDGSTGCVIAATSISIDATCTAIGTRPLVLIATGAISISGTLDASSTFTRTGAGADLASVCAMTAYAAHQGADDTGGAGGGAGGGFGTAGGAGGTGDLNNSAAPSGTGLGGAAGGAQPTPTVLRGGCRGAPGGAGGQARAVGGSSGGAVYLIAGTQITITGNVYASGSGGLTSQSGNPYEQGGGGGGSGGMIGIAAPGIMITGRIAANGGGGGGGGNLVSGGLGGPGSTLAYDQAAIGGTGAPSSNSGPGGMGGAGAALGVATNGGDSDCGGGGGGGGRGVTWIDGPVTGTPQISPPPTAH